MSGMSVSERVKQAEKHVDEQLSYGGIFPRSGPFGTTLEYRYQDGDLDAEIVQMRRLADALHRLADALEPADDLSVQTIQARLLTTQAVRNVTMLRRDAKRLKKKSLQVFGTEYPLGVCQQAMAVSRGFTSFAHLEAMSAKLECRGRQG